MDETLFIKKPMEGKEGIPGRAIRKNVVHYGRWSVMFKDEDPGTWKYSGSGASWRSAWEREIAVIPQAKASAECHFP
jgi:hypothetical protein